MLTALTWVAVVRVHPRAGELHAPAMAVLSAVAVFFFAVSRFASNPFTPVSPVPADGPGPNPLLQDHLLMGIHPPLLYLGYVGLTVPFAYALSALITGRTGHAWIEVTRRWTLGAWIFLTLGIVMGSWWSYAVLGWGGYWAWDPVENASLLPWLTSTALVHSVLVQRRRATLQVWNLVLATSSFLLVLIGTFLTRSGVLASVHAFTRSALGPILLGAVVAVMLAVGGLLVWRSDRLGNETESGPLLSREGVFLANNVLLLGLAFTVLLGTVFPLLVEAVNGQRVSVGSPYFDRLTVPVALTVVLLTGVGPLVPWGRADPAELLRDLAWPFAAAATVVAGLAATGLRGPTALLTFGLSALVVVSVAGQLARDTAHERARTGRGRLVSLGSAFGRRRRYYGGMTTHLGIVLAAVAIAASSTYAHDTTRPLQVGQTVALNGWTATLERIDRTVEGRRRSILAVLQVDHGGRSVGTYRPALSTYPRATQAVGTPAIRSTAAGDVYLTMTEVDPAAGTATIRIATNPLIGWLWASSGVMALGALLAALPPARRRRPVDVPAPRHHDVLEPVR